LGNAAADVLKRALRAAILASKVAEDFKAGVSEDFVAGVLRAAVAVESFSPVLSADFSVDLSADLSPNREVLKVRFADGTLTVRL
jgi:hypothetical protein